MIELVLRSEARYFELAQLEAAIDRKLDVLHFKGRVNTNSSLITGQREHLWELRNGPN